MNYYEQVRDEVERLAECTTSDAQGIIGAWELRNGKRPVYDADFGRSFLKGPMKVADAEGTEGQPEVPRHLEVREVTPQQNH